MFVVISCFFFLVGVFFLVSFSNYDQEVMLCYIRKFPGEMRNQG